MATSTSKTRTPGKAPWLSTTVSDNVFDLIAFDADDTLWYTETHYVLTQERLKEILAPYDPGSDVEERLFKTEMRNLNIFGYGAKGFLLSMIETAIELTDGRVLGRDIQQIIDAVRLMLAQEIRLLDHIADVVPQLAARWPLMVITKGDQLEQESKIARSGLADYFDLVEIVSHKDQAVYRDLFARHEIDPHRLLMVGNSMRSDILPILALGGQAVHIPHELTWAHEQVDVQDPPAGYYKLDHAGQLPLLLDKLLAKSA